MENDNSLTIVIVLTLTLILVVGGVIGVVALVGNEQDKKQYEEEPCKAITLSI